VGYGYGNGRAVALIDGVTERVRVILGVNVIVRVAVPSGMGYGYPPIVTSVGDSVIDGVRVRDGVRVSDGVRVNDGVRDRVGERRSANVY
jgi:hypothetical protein